ncbi:MAG: sugar phosphate isomerase/epimerase [Anaerolineae bacterium]|jgi:sugar phosphate isomerase/epimerase|nr:sugar phosphate isomerase/epimerase [Anaerolineae bacterium]
MNDTLLLSASRANVRECIDLAAERGLGVEVMAFAFPDVLDGDWRMTMAQYRQLLRDVPGEVTLHGPFMDMVSGSPDPRINAVCVARYSAAIRIAAELEARHVILHANFIGTLHNTFYRTGWHRRNVEFWAPVAEYARQHGVQVLLENMWEFDPTIISDLIQAVNHPSLGICLDVGHAHLFTDPRFAFDDWLTTMAPWLHEVHMNNNNGILDEHHGFDWAQGVLNYGDLLPRIRATNPGLKLVLEMDSVQDMRDSLYYFRLPEIAR